MDVEIISRETIKPCFPTPDNLKHYKLCSLDLMAPDTCIALVFFYPNNHDSEIHEILDVDERIAVLKKSLSEILARFFPLAGTINDDGLSVDCDDRGASFTTAKVNSCSLSEFLGESPNLELITQLFLPLGGNIITTHESNNYLTNIQATIFEKYGGIALGTCISHRVCDGTALSFFLKSWAETAAAYTSSVCNKLHHVLLNNNYNNNIVSPDFFAASSLFPARDLRVREVLMTGLASSLRKGQFITRRFVFDGSAIATLKQKADLITDNNYSNNIIHVRRPPTRVEVVTAFIWKYAMAACNDEQDYYKPSQLTHMVNLRGRAGSRLTQHSFGNLCCIAAANITAEKRSKKQIFPDLVDEVRSSISKIDGELVKKMIDSDGEALSVVLQHAMEDIETIDLDIFGFSSWCKFGFYEIDFGWGKPAWVSQRDSSTGPVGVNFTILMDTKCGKGIEAWVTLDERQMAVLESNQEFRTFASVNPSPLAMPSCN